MILVKIGRVGGIIKEFAVDYKTTLEQALKLGDINIDFNNEDINYNGVRLIQPSMGVYIRNNDLILIQKKLVSVSIKIKAGRIGEVLQEFDINPALDINSILIKAGKLPFEYEEVWLHRKDEQKGINVSLSWKGLMDGDSIIIEDKQPLSKVKRLIEEFDSEDMYADEDIHSLSLSIIQFIKDYYKIN